MLIKYKLRSRVELYESDNTATLICTATSKTLTLNTTAISVVKKLESGWLTEDELLEDCSDLNLGYFALIKMQKRGMLDAEVSDNGQTFFSISPSPQDSAFKNRIKSGAVYRLNRYAYLHQWNNCMLLESPFSISRITVSDSRLAGTLQQLCSGLRLDISDRITSTFISTLLSLNFIEIANKTVADDPMDFWEFHDLLFHARTLDGKNCYPTGGTYRFQEKRPPLPALKPQISATTIDLPEPSRELLEKLNQPFSSVLNKRCSKTDFTDAQLTLDELGALLHVSARVKKILNISARRDQITMRPSPSGGARHALEIYPLIRECEAIEPGPYHYDPQKHRLERIETGPSDQKWLIEDNPYGSLDGKPPQITLNITARIGRTSWKYESIAYKLINQDMGCLYQTFYMTATALELSPCAQGSIDARRLGETHGIDWREEPFIGAFTIGK